VTTRTGAAVVTGAGAAVVGAAVVGAAAVGAAVVGAAVVGAAVIGAAGADVVTTAAGKTTAFTGDAVTTLLRAASRTGFSVKISTNFTSSGFSLGRGFLPGCTSFLSGLKKV